MIPRSRSPDDRGADVVEEVCREAVVVVVDRYRACAAAADAGRVEGIPLRIRAGLVSILIEVLDRVGGSCRKDDQSQSSLY